MNTPIKLAIVDDNSFYSKAMSEKLSFFEDIQVRFIASDGEEAIQKVVQDKHLDIVLMDIEMPGTSGIEAAAAIKHQMPHLKIIMLTAFDNDEHIFNAIKAGADGYLLKDASAQKLYQGIRDTLEGGAAMTPSIALKTIKLLQNPIEPEAEDLGISKLTDRELEVLQQISNGLSYTQIAENLFVSPSTIRKHTENIYKKLQVNSKLEAVARAKQQRLL